MDELVVQYLESIRDRYEPTNSFTDYKKVGGFSILRRSVGETPLINYHVLRTGQIITTQTATPKRYVVA